MNIGDELTLKTKNNRCLWQDKWEEIKRKIS